MTTTTAQNGQTSQAKGSKPDENLREDDENLREVEASSSDAEFDYGRTSVKIATEDADRAHVAVAARWPLAASKVVTVTMAVILGAYETDATGKAPWEILGHNPPTDGKAGASTYRLVTAPIDTAVAKHYGGQSNLRSAMATMFAEIGANLLEDKTRSSDELMGIWSQALADHREQTRKTD